MEVSGINLLLQVIFNLVKCTVPIDGAKTETHIENSSYLDLYINIYNFYLLVLC